MVMAGFILLLFSAPASAKGLLGANWDVSFPMGELENTISSTSLKGFGVEYKF